MLRTQPRDRSGDITVSTSDTYTPKAGDVGGTLTVTATYFDGQSAPRRHYYITRMPETEAFEHRLMLRGTPGTRRRCSGTRTLTRVACRTARPPGRWRRAPRAPLVLRLMPLTPRLPGQPEALRYRLSGTDMSSFSVDNSGQITVEVRDEAGLRGQADLHGNGHGHGPPGRILLHPRDHRGHQRGRSAGDIRATTRSVTLRRGRTPVATYTASGP